MKWRGQTKEKAAQLSSRASAPSPAQQRRGERPEREREREINNTTSNLIGRVCLISAMGDLDVRHDGRERERKKGERGQ